MIQYKKALGMNLIQIKECFEEKNLEKLRQVLEFQKKNIEKQMAEMYYAKQAVERAIQSYRRYNAATEEHTVVLEYMKERKIFYYDTKINCYS